MLASSNINTELVVITPAGTTVRIILDIVCLQQLPVAPHGGIASTNRKDNLCKWLTYS